MDKTLGIVELETKAIEQSGFLAGPDTFDFDLLRQSVPGAFTRNIVDGDSSVEKGYVNAAKDLERQGASAIISNCGFTGVFQAAVSEAVSVPVAMSTMLLVPLLAAMLPPGRSVGILTYDSTKLTENHFTAAGWSTEKIKITIGGIEGTESWRELATKAPKMEIYTFIDDIRSAARNMIQSNPEIGAFVFECTAFPVAAEAVRADTGLLVADITTLARMVFGMSATKCAS